MTPQEMKNWYSTIEDCLRTDRITPAEKIDAGTYFILSQIVPGAVSLPRWSGQFEAMCEVDQKIVKDKKVGDMFKMNGYDWKVVAVFHQW